nr:DUF998 domain-containing protein [Nakamurella flavida]
MIHRTRSVSTAAGSGPAPAGEGPVPSAGALVAAWAAAALWAIAGLWSFTTEAVTADAMRRYSYLTNYVSDLGIPRAEALHGVAATSPLAAVMNLGFILEGLLFLAAACFAVAAWVPIRDRRMLLGLAAVHAVGVVLVGCIHGSPAAERDNTIVIHFLGAGMAILGGNAVLLLVGRIWRADGRLRPLGRVSTALGVLGVTGLVMVSLNLATGSSLLFPDGVWERLAVYSVLVWGVVLPAAAAIRLWRSAGRAGRGSSSPVESGAGHRVVRSSR